MKNIVKMAVGIIALCFSPFCMAQQSDCAVNSVLFQENEVPVFITIGQSNADGSAFADAGEDRRLAAWYDNPDTNPGLMKIWYRSCHIVKQTDGGRCVFVRTNEDVALGSLDIYYRGDDWSG